MTKTTRREAFERYRPLVTKIALGIGRGVPKHIPREDLISAGNLGLVQAMRHWTPDANPDGFRLYASSRIRGAVLDELRGADPLSRRDRQAISRVNQAERAHRARLGQSVPPHTIATRCGLDETEYHRLKCAELAAQTHGTP